MSREIELEKYYWDHQIQPNAPYIHYDDAEYRQILNLLENDSFQGKFILETGCGEGVWTANLVRLGANVVNFDLTPAIVQRANHRAEGGSLGFCGDMNFLPFPDGTFDLLFGSMVLHHAQNHKRLGMEICRVLKPGGKAVFHENSSRNPILMMARGKLVGRWGIPKHSSPGEHPLRPEEIVQIGEAFKSIKIYYGRMVFLQMAVKYLLKRETGFIYQLSRKIDHWIYRWLPVSRPLTYYQILEFNKS